MSQNKDLFEFLNSDLWIRYTQENYRTLDEIYYRLNNASSPVKDWEHLKHKILSTRKTGAIPLFLKALDKKFWFYPADCILRKAHEIEKKGIALYDKIATHASFANDFVLDARIEEAITSAIYEGANSTRAQAQELIASEAVPASKDEWMLFNNYQAMQWITKNQNREITTDLVNEIHAIVTKHTLQGDDANFSGKLRNDRVFVMKGGETKHEGVNYKLLDATLSECIALSTKNSRYFPPVLKGMLLHYFIAYVHPYFDGNGRTARTLFYFKAMKNNLRFVELLSVSAYLKDHRNQYEASFEKVVGNELDITYFIDFNLDALLKALEIVYAKVEFLLKIPVLKKVFSLSDQQIGLLQRMALHKFRKIDIEGYGKTIDKSREVARQELKQLADLKFLEEGKSSKKLVYSIDKEALEQSVAQYS